MSILGESSIHFTTEYFRLCHFNEKSPRKGNLTNVHKLAECLVGCNNDTGGFHEDLVTFRDPELPSFYGLKRCASKNAVLRCNKKSGKSGSVAPKCKKAENLLRIDRHRLKIGLNPIFLGYSNIP